MGFWAVLFQVVHAAKGYYKRKLFKINANAIIPLKIADKSLFFNFSLLNSSLSKLEHHILYHKNKQSNSSNRYVSRHNVREIHNKRFFLLYCVSILFILKLMEAIDDLIAYYSALLTMNVHVWIDKNILLRILYQQATTMKQQLLHYFMWMQIRNIMFIFRNFNRRPLKCYSIFFVFNKSINQHHAK